MPVPDRLPPGWPEGLRPPGADDWERHAVGWLLDQCPGDYRGYPLLRRHPVVLARLTAWQVAAALGASRDGIAAIRRELRGRVAPDVVEAAVTLLEREVERLTRLAGQVAAVEAALGGQRFVPRL